MFGIRRRRTLIRVLSYTVSAFLLAVLFAVVGLRAAYKLRMSIEYSYERALGELSEHVDNIDIALQKGYYASTSTQLVGLSAQIWSDASAAKTDLSQMPLSNVNLNNTTKFLSQAGDYADALGKKLASNQKIAEADRQTIKGLSDYAKKLSTQLSGIQNNIQKGRITLFKSDAVLNNTNVQNKAVQTSVEDGFQSIEKSFSGLPSMIYDGPFSDNIQKKTPALTQGLPDVGREKARANAASFLSAQATNVKDSGETAGVLPTYNFTCGTVNIFVTKNGGYVTRMLDSRATGEMKLSQDDAIKKAADFLQRQGLTSMTQTYYLLNNGISTVNFAYQQSGVTYYPDLVKVGVSMADGAVISFDATGYIMNHSKRTIPAAKVSQTAVRALLNPHLTVNKQSMVIIPTDGGGEALCYEYRCTGENNQSVIDYFNAQTGTEQQVLILIDTPGGSLPT